MNFHDFDSTYEIYRLEVHLCLFQNINGTNSIIMRNNFPLAGLYPNNHNTNPVTPKIHFWNTGLTSTQCSTLVSSSAFTSNPPSYPAKTLTQNKEPPVLLHIQLLVTDPLESVVRSNTTYNRSAKQTAMNHIPQFFQGKMQHEFSFISNYKLHTSKHNSQSTSKPISDSQISNFKFPITITTKNPCKISNFLISTNFPIITQKPNNWFPCVPRSIIKKTNIGSFQLY